MSAIAEVTNHPAVEPLLVAIDDGYAQTKLYGAVAGKEPLRHKTRSSIRTGSYALTNVDGSGSHGVYETENAKYTVQESTAAENTQFDGFHLSPLNRVLVHHALYDAGYANKPVKLIVGLPVGDYFHDAVKNEKKIDGKIANLKKPVTSTTRAGENIDLTEVRIGCQAIAAFYDWCLADDLSQRHDHNQDVAIVDIGGRTTDIAVIRGGTQLDPKSGTSNLGVLDAYKGLQHALQREFEINDEFPLADLDKAVRKRKVRLFGEEKDVSGVVDATLRELEEQIAREVERRVGSGATLGRILFVGGGSALFTQVSSHFRHGEILEDPEFANARGLFKFAQKFPG